MIVGTIVLVLIVALVAKMVIDVQKFKKKSKQNDLPHTLKYCVTLLSRELNDKDVWYEGDISDLGNEVGYALGNVIADMTEEQVVDFIHGLRHGISLTNGTH